jgi:O-acetyl-ADP-ribose deacetylase (regulator of RNase III)
MVRGATRHRPIRGQSPECSRCSRFTGLSAEGAPHHPHGWSGVAGGGHGEPEQLAGCYRRSLEIACDRGLASVAFPAISTGISDYPIADAAQVSVQTIAEFFADHALPDRVVLCTFGDEATRVVKAAVAAVRA